MRDLFDSSQSESPDQAIRRGARPGLRRRFYAKATSIAVAEGHAVRLDDKPVRTPARRILAAPTRELGEALAAEWDAQREIVDPAKMPLTRLVNAIIDGVAERPQPVADEIARYLASDLLHYRAAAPAELVERQAQHWDPIVAWAAQALGAAFKSTQGVMHVAQPEEALRAARAAIPDDPWRLGALHVVTTLTGSALIALALSRGFLSAEAAWQAANVDEDWNMEQWGRDELAMQRREFRFAELKAAAMVLQGV
ncbi:MAG TPA: ATP12 family protein [Xanthobacteraceae bacterium]|nr:ATP12 family protein [Xanthobacteraceae bacterium]